VRALVTHALADISAVSPESQTLLATGDEASTLRVTRIFSPEEDEKSDDAVLRERAHGSAPISAAAVVKDRIVISGPRGLAKIWFVARGELTPRGELERGALSEPTAFFGAVRPAPLVAGESRRSAERLERRRRRRAPSASPRRRAGGASS